MATPTNVLIVDNGTGTARSLGQAILAPGLRQREVHGGMEALREASASPPDLVIVDLTAESGEGFRLAPMLKMQARDALPRVVGISAMEADFLLRLEPELRSCFKIPSWRRAGRGL